MHELKIICKSVVYMCLCNVYKILNLFSVPEGNMLLHTYCLLEYMY